MVTSPEAIKRFLERVPADVPMFKGRAPEALERVIYDSTGATFDPKTTPRKAQLEGVAFALYLRRALLFYDMRMGKTKMALDWAEHLRKANLWHGKGLVIAHAPITLDVWEEQIAQHSRLTADVVRTEGALESLFKAVDSPASLLVTSWSVLQVLFSEKRLNRRSQPTLYPARDILRSIADLFTLTIIDEIHMCQNPYSLRFQIAELLLEHTKFAVGLTGTPFGSDPRMLWAQAALIDKGATLGYSYQFFTEAFSKQVKNPRVPSGKELVFDKAKLPVLQAKLSGLAMSYKLSEQQEVNIQKNVVKLRMSAMQQEAYNEVLDKLVELHSGDTVEITNTFIRLRQVASGYLPYEARDGTSKMVTFPASAKLEWLSELLLAAPKDVQLIVFYEYRHSGRMLHERLDKLKITHDWLYGDTKDKAGVVKAFQQQKIQVLVANTRTGGVGIDLPSADYLCFYESSVSPTARAQAEARPMSRGSRLLTIDDLVCAPVESRILDAINDGRDLLASIIHKPASWRDMRAT